MHAQGRSAARAAFCGAWGKTALAKELARRHVWRFPGGVAFTSVRTAALFGEATAVSLVRSANTALSLFGGGDPLQSLVEHLGRQPALVIFDNLEDLPEKELERLLYVIEQFPLGGPKAILTLRPSPELLRERPWLGSRTLTSGLSKHAGAAYVLYAAEMQRLRGFDEALAAEVVSRVSGHPKMIEIAVGMAATRGIEAMRAELGKGEGKALEERLEGLLSSSIGLLDEDGRWVLSLSGVFPGDTFSREEMVAAGDAALLQEGDELSARVEEARPRVERGIRACVAAGLVAWDEGRGVFGVHAAVQGFARGRMGLGEEVGARVVMGLVMQAYRYVGEHRGDFAALERRLGFLLAMFEVGWDWGEQFAKLRKMVVAAVDVMGSFFLRCGYWPVMERWRERLAAVVPEDRAALAARLYREAELLEKHGKREEAKAKALEVLRIQEERKDRRGVAASLHQLAIIESQQGRDDEARRLLQESIAVEEEIGNRAGLASSLVMLGQLEVQRGNLAEGRQLVQKSVDILEEIGGGELPTAREILASIDAMQTPP